MGYDQREPTPNELAAMKALLSEALESGAVGMSSGLVFPPGAYAATHELVELCKLVAARDRIHATHMRGYGPPFISSTREVLEVAERSSSRLQISHAAPYFPAWGDSREFLQLIDQARQAGIDVMFDELPCARGIGDLSRILPPHMQGMEPSEIQSALRDPKRRAYIRAAMVDSPSADWGSTISLLRARAFEKVILMTINGGEPELESLEDVARTARKDPVDAALDILAADLNSFVQMVEWNEEDLFELMASPYALVCIDSELVGADEPVYHPKDVGTFPSVIRKYVRGESRADVPDQGRVLMSLEEAVRRVTGAPAQILRLGDRGVLSAGAKADVVVFDPAVVSDQATYLHPSRSPIGISYVLVNGSIAVEKGTITNAQSGSVLRW